MLFKCDFAMSFPGGASSCLFHRRPWRCVVYRDLQLAFFKRDDNLIWRYLQSLRADLPEQYHSQKSQDPHEFIMHLFDKWEYNPIPLLAASDNHENIITKLSFFNTKWKTTCQICNPTRWDDPKPMSMLSLELQERKDRSQPTVTLPTGVIGDDSWLSISCDLTAPWGNLKHLKQSHSLKNWRSSPRCWMWTLGTSSILSKPFHRLCSNRTEVVRIALNQCRFHCWSRSELSWLIFIINPRVAHLLPFGCKNRFNSLQVSMWPSSRHNILGRDSELCPPLAQPSPVSWYTWRCPSGTVWCRIVAEGSSSDHETYMYVFTNILTGRHIFANSISWSEIPSVGDMFRGTSWSMPQVEALNNSSTAISGDWFCHGNVLVRQVSSVHRNDCSDWTNTK